MAGMKLNTMISYRSKDWEFVKELLDFLRIRGIEPWIDREGIEPGTKWRDELFRQLQQCDVCIVVLSKGYLQSEYCRMEVFVARSYSNLPHIEKESQPPIKHFFKNDYFYLSSCFLSLCLTCKSWAGHKLGTVVWPYLVPSLAKYEGTTS